MKSDEQLKEWRDNGEVMFNEMVADPTGPLHYIHTEIKHLPLDQQYLQVMSFFLYRFKVEMKNAQEFGSGFDLL